MKPKVTCTRCGTEFDRRQGKNIFCVSCAIERRLQTRRECQGRKKSGQGYRPAGMLVRCPDCEVEMVFKGGAHQFCKLCAKAKRKETYRAFRKTEKGIKLYQRLRRERAKRPDQIAYMRAYSVGYSQRRRQEPNNNLNHRMSSMVSRGLRLGKQGRSWVSLVGYDLESLIAHLERQFLPGMGWHNIGKWHVDHIVPLVSFKFETVSDPEFRAAWAMTNLRPLWSLDNIRKHARRELLL